jgi:hypothetical protein
VQEENQTLTPQKQINNNKNYKSSSTAESAFFTEALTSPQNKCKRKKKNPHDQGNNIEYIRDVY